MKNIILVILAILFIIMILFHFMDIHLEHFDCKQSDANDKISKLFYNIRISPTLRENIQNIISANALYTDDAIIQSLINLNIPDSALSSILTDSKTYPTSKDKIAKFKCVLKQRDKDEFDEGLEIHYPLDTIESDGVTIRNQSINYALAEPEKSYHGTLKSIQQGTLPSLDNNDSRGLGTKSMRFKSKGNDLNGGGGYIEINKMPTFWDKTNTIFSGFSLALWVKASPYGDVGGNSHWARIIDFATGQYYNNNILVSVTDTHNPSGGQLAFITANGTWENPDTGNGLTYVDPAGNGVLDSTWRHCVFTISASNPENICNYKIYINGVLMNSNYYNLKPTANQPGVVAWAIAGPDPKTSKPPNNLVRTQNYIGKSNFPWDNLFDGWMADFRIYSRELPESVVKRLYNYVNPVISISNAFNSQSSILANAARPPAYPGAPAEPAIKVNIMLVASPETMKNSAGVLTWLDQSGYGNHAVARNTAVKFCPITKKVTIPSANCMDIKLNNQTNYGCPFTMFFVANVKNFKTSTKYRAPSNRIIGSPDYNGIEIGFSTLGGVAPNGGCFVNVQGSGGYAAEPLGMSGINPNGINIYTFQFDKNGQVMVWINSVLVINKKTVYDKIALNRALLLGAAFGPDPNNGYPSEDDLDYHQFIHVSGILNIDAIKLAEAWMASIWNIKSKINPNDNQYISYQFA